MPPDKEDTALWPTEIRLQKDRKVLVVAFDDGHSHALSAEYLRVHSPSAEVQGHHPDQRVTVAGKRNAEIAAIEPVGNYAVRLTFNDGHDTGLFSWSLLNRLGQDKATMWAAYIADLKAKGLGRD